MFTFPTLRVLRGSHTIYTLITVALINYPNKQQDFSAFITFSSQVSSCRSPTYLVNKFSTFRYYLTPLHRYLPRVVTIRHYWRLFVTIRDYSRLFVLFAIRDCSLFAIRYPRLFAICYSGFPHTQWDHCKFILKQLDYSPSFSTSDSWTRRRLVGYLRSRARSLIV